MAARQYCTDKKHLGVMAAGALVADLLGLGRKEARKVLKDRLGERFLYARVDVVAMAGRSDLDRIAAEQTAAAEALRENPEDEVRMEKCS
jgi:uncharacterized membrane protein YebE (DUF533 family)